MRQVLTEGLLAHSRIMASFLDLFSDSPLAI